MRVSVWYMSVYVFVHRAMPMIICMLALNINTRMLLFVNSYICSRVSVNIYMHTFSIGTYIYDGIYRYIT